MSSVKIMAYFMNLVMFKMYFQMSSYVASYIIVYPVFTQYWSVTLLHQSHKGHTHQMSESRPQAYLLTQAARSFAGRLKIVQNWIIGPVHFHLSNHLIAQLSNGIVANLNIWVVDLKFVYLKRGTVFDFIQFYTF